MVEYKVTSAGGWGITHTCRREDRQEGTCRCPSYSLTREEVEAWGLNPDGLRHVEEDLWLIPSSVMKT